jgi:outer membrane murein-binding lipoprotein Lpp
MAERRTARLLAVALVAGATLVAGCVTEEQKQDAQLLQLLTAIQGTYDNNAQVDRETKSGMANVHARVTLVVLHVATPRLGKYVMYAQESASDDPLRIMSQRMLSFQVDDKQGIVETVYTFNEPMRWREGINDPGMFEGVTKSDVRTALGCELLWSKDEEKFSAAYLPGRCRSGGEPGFTAAELTPDSLKFGSYEYRKLGQ